MLCDEEPEGCLSDQELYFPKKEIRLEMGPPTPVLKLLKVGDCHLYS